MAILNPMLFSVLTPEGVPNQTTTQDRLLSLRSQMPPEMRSELDQRMPLGPQTPQPSPSFQGFSSQEPAQIMQSGGQSPTIGGSAPTGQPGQPDPVQIMLEQAQQLLGPKVTQQLMKEATNLEPPKLVGPDVFGRGGIMGTGLEPIDVLAFAIGAGITSNLPQDKALQRTMEIAQLPNLFKQNQRKAARDFIDSVRKQTEIAQSQATLGLETLKQRQAQTKLDTQQRIIDAIAAKRGRLDANDPLLVQAAIAGVGGLSLKDLPAFREGRKQIIDREGAGVFIVDTATGEFKEVTPAGMVPQTAAPGITETDITGQPSGIAVPGGIDASVPAGGAALSPRRIPPKSTQAKDLSPAVRLELRRQGLNPASATQEQIDIAATQVESSKEAQAEKRDERMLTRYEKMTEARLKAAAKQQEAKALGSEIQKRLADKDAMLEEAKIIDAAINGGDIAVSENEKVTFRPNDYKNFLGSITGRTYDLRRESLMPGTAPAETEVMFRSALENLTDQLLRSRSGAAINESEAARLRKILPKPTDKPEVFVPGWKRFKRELESSIKTGKLWAGKTVGSVRRESAGQPAGSTSQSTSQPISKDKDPLELF